MFRAITERIKFLYKGNCISFSEDGSDIRVEEAREMGGSEL